MRLFGFSPGRESERGVRRMKNKLLVYVAIGILLANSFPTAALAGGPNHNTVRSNEDYELVLLELGVGAEGIETILSATDDEILALIAYKNVRKNIKVALMRQGGIDGAIAESVVSKIAKKNTGPISDRVLVEPQGAEVKTPISLDSITDSQLRNKVDCCMNGSVGIAGTGALSVAPGGTNPQTNPQRISEEGIKSLLSSCCGVNHYGINEEGIKSLFTTVNHYGINEEGVKQLFTTANHYGINEEGVKSLNAGLGGLIQSALDYNAASGNVITAMKKYGVKDGQIPGLLDIVYAPIKIADAIGDYFGPALESYPFLGNIVGNERMNVHLTISTPGHKSVGKATFSVVTRNNKVETVTYGEIPNLDPTLNIYLDQETVAQITAGKMTLPDALLQGRMRYEGVGFFGSVKVAVVNAIFGVLQFTGVAPKSMDQRGGFAVSGRSST